ncbi:DNA topoisomerase 2 [Savitreella phatthalungensis]
MSSDDDYTENYEPTPVAAKSTKRSKVIDSDVDDSFNDTSFSSPKPAKKRAPAKKILNESHHNEILDDDVSVTSTPKAASKRAAPTASKAKASDQYQKLTQLEHVIKRPDTYIGSIEAQQQEMWTYSAEREAMEFKKVTFVPGLFKIFDEILVNAADNKQRDPTMDTLKVDFDREANTISVYNNGQGIPVEIHEKEGIYIPELIFGHLLTSSNYDDDERKTTGGRNGFGAKLANIFSTEFTLETADKKNGKKYVQTWTNNMSSVGKAKVTSNKTSEYTKVVFKPDLTKFGMTEMDEDFEGILRRRVYDLAGCVPGVKVFLNGERIRIKNFKEYVGLYTKSMPEREKPAPVVYESVNDRWEVAFTISEGQFNQVSFVNSIATTKGGTHVEHVAIQLVNRIVQEYAKKNKKAAALKPFQVRQNVWLFVNCKIENPAFDSQTKETLTLKQSQFGSKCNLSEDFLKKVIKSGILDDLSRQSEARADKALKKTDGSKRSRITGMAKLEDANKAGTREGERCTLILTEGDSAKALAIAGMSVVGRDHFGVFPLRGKLLNVREASATQIQANTEIQNIKQILGLKHGSKYESAKDLRYGHLMIMTDQDHDGSHIKGLIINYLEFYYPSLLEIPGFLIEFITPIVRCTKGKEVVSFFTLPEYEQWREQVQPGKEWKIKYFKGLGTSDSNDAKKYFSDLDRHLKEFHTLQPGDKDLISLAFAKKQADDRKEWLREFRPGTFMDHSVARIPISDFINKELILFSLADNVRSIPSIIDGFKPGQRKIIYACFKRKLKQEIKVAQLVGYVGEHTAYHHGEQSLAQTIVGLAQTFVGSNNINILMPNGQFGTRHQGGKDAASPRYIFTDLSKIARRIFCEADAPLLNYLNDDGLSIEPEWYVPVLPMVLVNGAAGIGTGWSTSIPNFDPREIVDNLRRMMRGEEPVKMHPWYRGFTGPITADPDNPNNYRALGTIEEIDDNTLQISELPIGFWTQNMKEFLEKGIAGDGDKNPAWIKDYADNSTESNVHFTITLSDAAMKEAQAVGLQKKFKLSEGISMGNLVAFDAEGRIKKYSSCEDILADFYHVRLRFYQKRKDWMTADLERQLDRLSNQARFVQMIISRELVVSNRKRSDLVTELDRLKFTSFPTKKLAHVAGEVEDVVEEEAEEAAVNHKDHGYDYLLGMAIWSLTKERVERLLRDRATKEEELTALLKLSAKDLWSTDLDAFMQEWEALLEQDEADRQKATAIKKNKRASKIAGGAAGRGKKRAAADDDDDYSPAKKKSTSSAAVKREPVPKKPKLVDNSSPVSVLADAKSTGPPTPVKKEEPAEDNDDVFAFFANKQQSKTKIATAPVSTAQAALGPAQGVKPKPAPKRVVDSDDDDDWYGRLAGGDDNNDAAAATTIKKASSSASTTTKKEAAPKKKVPAAAAAKPAAKAKKQLKLDSDDEELLADAPSKAQASAPKARRAAAAKKPSYAIDSEEEDDRASDSDGSVDFSDGDDD